MITFYRDYLSTIIMKSVWLICSVAIVFCCRVRAVSENRPTKEQFLWDLNKSPPPEDDHEQVEQSHVSFTGLSTLGITRTRSPFVQKKRKNFGNLPELVKEVECKHSRSCIHWKSMTRKQKHVVSNRIYRQNNVSKNDSIDDKKITTNSVFLCKKA